MDKAEQMANAATQSLKSSLPQHGFYAVSVGDSLEIFKCQFGGSGIRCFAHASIKNGCLYVWASPATLGRLRVIPLSSPTFIKDTVSAVNALNGVLA